MKVKNSVKSAAAGTVRRRKKIRFTQDTCFDIVVTALLLICIVVMFYPIWFVLVASFSDPTYVNNGSFLILPRGFTLLGYQSVFEDSRIWIGYVNTLIYTIGGTAIGTLITMMAGYDRRRPLFRMRKEDKEYFMKKYFPKEYRLYKAGKKVYPPQIRYKKCIITFLYGRIVDKRMEWI